jgi:hypothetical protein
MSDERAREREMATRGLQSIVKLTNLGYIELSPDKALSMVEKLIKAFREVGLEPPPGTNHNNNINAAAQRE